MLTDEKRTLAHHLKGGSESLTAASFFTVTGGSFLLIYKLYALGISPLICPGEKPVAGVGGLAIKSGSGVGVVLPVLKLVLLSAVQLTLVG